MPPAIPARFTLFEEADLVIALGASLNSFTMGEGKVLFPNAKIARVSTALDEVHDGAVPDMEVSGDANDVLGRVISRIEELDYANQGFRTAETAQKLSAKPPELRSPGDGVDPRDAMGILSRCLPAETHVSCGIGHYFSFPVSYLALPLGGSMDISHEFGAIGSGLPMSFGACIAQPSRPHLLIEGDGSLMQHLQELETIVRYGKQMVVLVMNDGGYGAEVHKFRSVGGTGAIAQWESPDFVPIAKAMGGDGVTLTDLSEFEDAARKGLAQGGLFLIDLRISPTTAHERYEHAFFGKNQLH